MPSSTIRSGVLTSILLGLFLGFVFVPRGAQSFVPNNNLSNSKFIVSMAGSPDDESAFIPKTPVKCPDCDKCDGSGRIEGGIGTVLKFWPIKCFRPCPQLIENGGVYTRSGQGLDEIAFGRDTKYKYDPMDE